jgi:hypothetical protein
LREAIDKNNLRSAWVISSFPRKWFSLAIMKALHNFWALIASHACRTAPQAVRVLFIVEPMSSRRVPTSGLPASIISRNAPSVSLSDHLVAWQSEVRRNLQVTELSTDILADSSKVSVTHYLFQSAPVYAPLPSPSVPPPVSGGSGLATADNNGGLRKHILPLPPPTEDSGDSSKRARILKKPVQAPPGTQILQPVSTDPNASETILSASLPQVKGGYKSNGKTSVPQYSSLCLRYLLGLSCESRTPCGYHLHLDGGSLKGPVLAYQPLRDFVRNHSSLLAFTPAAQQNLVLFPPPAVPPP